MLHCTARDIASQFGDLLGSWARVGAIDTFESGIADEVQIDVVAPDQFDEDGFLGFEMVVQTAGENARGVGDLLERASQARRRDDGIGSLEDLGTSGRVGCGLVCDGREFGRAGVLLAYGPAAAIAPPSPNVSAGENPESDTTECDAVDFHLGNSGRVVASGRSKPTWSSTAPSW
jgi:hypothetical protein